MFNSGILDVAVGLVFLYLLLSLICSAVNELIEAKLRMRAKDLEQGLRELLYDLDGTGLVKKLYEHPLVFGPYQTRSPSCNFVVAEKPSYIPARNFALALMDIISPARGSAISGAAFATVLPSSLSDTQTALTSSLRQAIAQPATENPLSQNRNIQQALLALVDAAGNDINQARENIENWFNSAMDQVSGWYKRRTQRIILGLGLAVAIAVNADTISLARSLSMDIAMRGSLAAAAVRVRQ